MDLFAESRIRERARDIIDHFSRVCQLYSWESELWTERDLKAPPVLSRTTRGACERYRFNHARLVIFNKRSKRFERDTFNEAWDRKRGKKRRLMSTRKTAGERLKFARAFLVYRRVCSSELFNRQRHSWESHSRLSQFSTCPNLRVGRNINNIR